jgi:N-acetylmuramoyl-L-alanine amidase
MEMLVQMHIKPGRAGRTLEPAAVRVLAAVVCVALNCLGGAALAQGGAQGGAEAAGPGGWSTLAATPPVLQPPSAPVSRVQPTQSANRSVPVTPGPLAQSPALTPTAPYTAPNLARGTIDSRFDPLAMDAVATQALRSSILPPTPVQTSVPASVPASLHTAAQLADPNLAGSGVVKPGRQRPLIVIDPGHGGVDPGAVGPSASGAPVLEKVVVLAVAKLLAATLLASGRYDVVMTRSGDTFVPLDQRGAQSRRLGADLFISIHADSVAANSRAQDVRGATVYTLSDQASDEQARMLADKENAADQTAGLPAVAALDQDQVRSILVDLMRRETSEFSTAFRGIVTAELAQRIAMAREPQRAAAFRVLKQTEVPAVLIELGYMTNAQDQKLLQSAAWQSQVAGALSRSIDSFFATRKITAGRQ